MRYAIRKCLILLASLLVMSFLTFFAFTVIPGDSAAASLGTEATPEQIAALQKTYGLDEPLPVRYAHWLSGALSGDFGTSSAYGVGALALLADKFPTTLTLGLLSILLILLIALPLGILTSRRRGTAGDRIFTLVNQTFMSIPPFFLGMLITLLFGLLLRWFQPGSFVKPQENFVKSLSFLFYPALAIAIPKAAMLVRFIRTSFYKERSQDYVRTARSKGMTERQVIFSQILKNAMIPVITFFGMMIAEILAGSIIVEQVFNLPGIGRLLVVSIANRDNTVVQAIVLYTAGLVLVINALVDLMYHVLDPRVAAGGAE